MRRNSDLNMGRGCRDRLMLASSVACIAALLISMLGLARALFDVTWPLGQSGAGRICLQLGREEAELQSLPWSRTTQGLSSRSSRPTTTLGPTISPSLLTGPLGPTHTPLPPTATLDPIITPMPATATLGPTPTLMPATATLGPTRTPILPAPTPAPAPAQPTATPITAQLNYSATLGHLFQAPILLNPEPDAQLQSEVHFQWQWDGQPLPEGLAFDLLIWSEAEHQEHQGTEANGVVETDPSLERYVDLDYVETIIEHGGGTYWWTVIVVQEEPYERAGAWGEKRPFTYSTPEPPAEPTTQNP